MRILITSTESMMLSFLIPHVENLRKNGHTVELACSEVEGRFDELIDIFYGSIRIFKIDLRREPSRIQNLNGLKQLKEIISTRKYDVVWTNEPVMGVMTRLAAKKERRKGLKLIYIAHGFHFFKGAPLKNWLLYFPVEWICAHWTDVLTTINREDYRLARKWMKAGQVKYIPGIGIDLNKFKRGTVDREDKRESLGVSPEDTMLLCVGELIERKNHRIVLEALKDMREQGIKCFICGAGPLEERLRADVETYHLDKVVTFLGFRRDISELCQAADIFILPSLQEGVSVALMEAVACKTTVICSNIRGNRDLIHEDVCLFDPNDSNDLRRCLREAIKQDMTNMNAVHYNRLAEYDLESILKEMSDMISREGVCNGGGLLKLNARKMLLHSLGINGSPVILLSVAELSDRKNQMVIIEAINKVRDLNIICLLVGMGYKEDAFRKRIAELGLQDKIYLLGFRRDIASLCRVADIFIHVPVREGLGIAPLEAMATGLPLISSEINGMKDYTLNHATGICVLNPRDSDEVACAIQNMTENPELRQRCSTINRLIARNFELKQSVEAVYKICVGE